MQISPTSTLLEAKRIMRVPVMRDGKVVGIISRANIVRAVGATTNEAQDITALRGRLSTVPEGSPYARLTL
jgi:predicted transcriptional regulator